MEDARHLSSHDGRRRDEEDALERCQNASHVPVDVLHSHSDLSWLFNGDSIFGILCA